MKEHLINLLFEEYKYYYKIDELKEQGIEMDFGVNTLDIVLDMIGFPREKPTGLDDEDSFTRDWLSEEFFQVRYKRKGKLKLIYNVPEGLYFESRDEALVKRDLSEFLQWLFDEYVEWENGGTEEDDD